MGRRRRIRYSAEFKAEAVRIVQTTETPLKEIARNLGAVSKHGREAIDVSTVPDQPQ